MLDDLVLRDYHEEVSNDSPLVRVLEPQADPTPNYIQYGWTSDTPSVKLPDEATIWDRVRAGADAGHAADANLG